MTHRWSACDLMIWSCRSMSCFTLMDAPRYVIPSRQSPGLWCARSHQRIWSESLGGVVGNGSVEVVEGCIFWGAVGEEISILGDHFGEEIWWNLSQKPMQQILKPRDPKCLTFTVSERHDLFRVLLQGAHAEVIIWLLWLVGFLWLEEMVVYVVLGDFLVFVRWRFQRLSFQSDRRQNEELIPFTTWYWDARWCKDGNIGMLGMDAISLGWRYWKST